LEYSGKYGKGDNPYLDMIKESKSFLKKDGILIIAIENRFGLKYWRGAPEDHTNILFDSLEGYPNYQGIRTLTIHYLITNSVMRYLVMSIYHLRIIVSLI